MIRPPLVTAAVIFRNEKQYLERCLQQLQWCDEVIAIDMESSDGSLDIARRYADRVFHVPIFPVAEPTRIAAARLARHDWVLLVDPDEILNPTLIQEIRQTLIKNPDAGAVCLPWIFHFKGEPLTGTIWGGTHLVKRMLIHRERCALLPYCNRITELLPGQREVKITGRPDNTIRHEWSDSYMELLHRHLVRYPHLDASRMFAEGKRFNLFRAITNPWRELNRCLRHYDGWRMGLRGFLLSVIYFLYVSAFEWMLLRYQFRGGQVAQRKTETIPTLIEDTKAAGRTATLRQAA